MNLHRPCQYLILVFLISQLSACGFQLRGNDTATALNSDAIFISSIAAGTIATGVKEQLDFQGVNTLESSNKAKYVISLRNERRDRNILTVSSTTGQVREVELFISVIMSVSDTNGQVLSNEQTITASRDLFFDDGAILAISDEEQLIYEELQRQVVNSVIRRLQAAVN